MELTEEHAKHILDFVAKHFGYDKLDIVKKNKWSSPTEYKMMSGDTDNSLANSFLENKLAFQEFLKATGFLHELSDATSIVVNPYDEIKGDASV